MSTSNSVLSAAVGVDALAWRREVRDDLPWGVSCAVAAAGQARLLVPVLGAGLLSTQGWLSQTKLKNRHVTSARTKNSRNYDGRSYNRQKWVFTKNSQYGVSTQVLQSLSATDEQVLSTAGRKYEPFTQIPKNIFIFYSIQFIQRCVNCRQAGSPKFASCEAVELNAFAQEALRRCTQWPWFKHSTFQWEGHSTTEQSRLS